MCVLFFAVRMLIPRVRRRYYEYCEDRHPSFLNRGVILSLCFLRCLASAHHYAQRFIEPEDSREGGFIIKVDYNVTAVS